MSIDTIRQKFLVVVSKTSSLDGIILAVGVGGLVVGILVDVFIIRLLCLVLVVGVGLLVLLAMRAKHFDLSGEMERGNVRPNLRSDSEMKKLVFDDLQSSGEGKFDADEFNERRGKYDGPVDEERRHPVIRESVSHSVVHQAHHKSEAQVSEHVFQISDFFDVDSAIYKGDSEPRTEFDFLLNKVLTLIKEMLFAHSVAFFWANHDKQQLVLEARVTDSSLFMKVRRFPVGHDLLSKVALSGRPELVTEVNPMSEGELFRYYESPASVKSFAGVPVFFSTMSNTE